MNCLRCGTPLDATFRACPRCGEPVTDFQRKFGNEPIDGKYELVQRLGAGGMGDVYKVRHTFLHTERVIKLIRPQISESSDVHDRFLREARMATRVQHPNVATLHDFAALPDGTHYMVWEFIDGENLAQRLRNRGTLPAGEAARIAIDALEGLEAIHRAGIVHRDISPENIMLARDGNRERVKIIDLGVAKIEDTETAAATQAGVFLGKLRYASPEHLGFLNPGERIDGRADLYSMGLVLYEMLTGRPAFEATSPHHYILHHSRDTPFEALELPQSLPGGTSILSIIKRALERDRNKRFESAADFADALRLYTAEVPVKSDAQTIALPLEGDATLRVRDTDALRTTERSARLPIPPRAPLPTDRGSTQVTERGDKPTLRQPPVAPASPQSNRALLVVLPILAALATGAIVFWLSRRDERPSPPAPTQPVATTSAPTATSPTETTPAQLSTATVDVVTATTPATATSPVTTTTAAATTTRPAPRPVPVATTPPPAPAPAPVTTTTAPTPAPAQLPSGSSLRAYTEGEGADSDANDELLEGLRKDLEGVNAIAVRGTGDALQTIALVRAVKDSVKVSDDADVIVQFNGNLERLGRGRKRRSVEATIYRKGRPIFRYVMPPQFYRVGDEPAEAFARVLLNALDR